MLQNVVYFSNLRLYRLLEMTCIHILKTHIRHRRDINNNTAGKKTTRLSAHTRALKEKSKDFTIDWKIIKKSNIYNPITKKCMFCLKEKFYIMYDRKGSSLNKRNEVFNTCRHREYELLENFDT